jgi:predicted short-subunit dehydrogenase-like oxidoreductase (DUF2520 family)
MSEPATSRVRHAPAPATESRSARSDATPASIAVVGRGRAGQAFAAALRAAGHEVLGPLGRGEAPRAEAVLLCVPDAAIPDSAADVAAASGARLVGHVSGATPLAALAPAVAAGADLFGLHPLQTLTGPETSLAGAGCAVAGSTPEASAAAAALARSLGMRPFEISDEGRASYHAAASIASNFLVTLEAAAESVAGAAGFSPDEARALLAPLVRTTVESWATRGPENALTGPVARGDERTVTVQREAVAAADASLLPLFDALVERTRALAAAGTATGAAPGRAELRAAA